MMETVGSSPCLEDIPELIHRIQMLLPVKEAARTSVLSKSWLHAWSTIHILRFRQAVMSLSKEQKRHHLEVFDRTLIRYMRDNIPIRRVSLEIDNENKESVDKWIRRLATTKSNINLTIRLSGMSFTLPDEILSGKDITKLSVSCRSITESYSLLMSSHPVIHCVSLQKLHLERVHLNEDLLHDILFACSLLVELELIHCKGFNAIKFKNLRRLRKLIVDSYEPNLDILRTDSYEGKRILENIDFPNLNFFWSRQYSFSFNKYSLGSVTHLYLGDVIMDNAFLDMIKLKFPSLKHLTLYMRLWIMQSFHFTCGSMKSLTLLRCPHSLINVQVNAPQLTSFRFEGNGMPTFVFPAAVNISLLERINLTLYLSNPVDASFFLKISQALALTIKCDIEITTMNKTVIQPPVDIDMLDLRKRVPSPATNVQQLSFETTEDEGLWQYSPFFDAFFSICHPKYVVAQPDTEFEHNNHFSEVMVSEVMEKKNIRKSMEYLNWPSYLNGFEIKTEKGETLPDYLKSYLDGTARGCVVFELKWR